MSQDTLGKFLSTFLYDRQRTRTSNEDVETTNHRGHEGGRGHCGYGHKSHGMEEEDYRLTPCI